MNVYAEKSRSATMDPIIAPIITPIIAPIIAPISAKETVGQEEPRTSYASDSYQKILDYHIAEIFLTTLVFGAIVLLRHHH
jgi:hypothetical protein